MEFATTTTFDAPLLFGIGRILRLSLNPVGGYWLVGIASAFLLALLAIGPQRDRVSARRRRTLLALRTLIILLLIAAMVRPTLVWTETTKQSATLVMLIDRSRSMLVGDAVGKRTRWDALRATLDDALPALKELQQDLEIKLYTFDRETQSVEFANGKLELEKTPAGEETAIGAALETILRQEAGKRLAGVIVLGDGAQRAIAPRDVAPQIPARRLADLGFKLYAVAFGQARGLGEARDVAIVDMLANQTVFVKNPLAVTGTARIEGYAGKPIPLQLLMETSPGGGKMATVATSRVTAKESGERLPVHLVYEPQVPGEFKVTLKFDPQPGELVTTNNQISTFVTVLKGGLNVLYLNGSLLPEQKFLRRALDASPEIKVDYLYIRADKPQTRPDDLAERFQPGKYDVYLIGDLDSAALTKEDMAALAKAVDGGSGFMMLGGLHSFGPGGYGQTSLAEVLPIQIDRFERQDFDEKVRQDLHLAGPQQMIPTQSGETQSLMLLAARAKNKATWAALPPLDGANRLGKVKPGALVLAESQNKAPLLVAKEFGRGRVLAFAGDSTWRQWWMRGFETPHKRFWRQTILWLARKDEAAEGKVWIKLDQRRYGPGGRVEFTAGAETAEGEPITDARFEAEVILPDKQRRPAQIRGQGSEAIGSFIGTQDSGDYTLVVTATRASQNLGTAQARFLVYDQDLELDNPAADRHLLDSLASMTRGKSIPPERLSKLLGQMKEETKELDVETQVKDTLYDNWPFLLVVVGVMCGEWYLRKRWGLV